eukprot:6176083-Pleurochrysis_carterae.AAC.3
MATSASGSGIAEEAGGVTWLGKHARIARAGSRLRSSGTRRSREVNSRGRASCRQRWWCA